LIWRISDGNEINIKLSEKPEATLTYNEEAQEYYYVDGSTSAQFTVSSDGLLSSTISGEKDGYKYKVYFTAGGFLEALIGTWEGSNGSASGTIEGISGSGTLKSGTAIVGISKIDKGVVFSSLVVESVWSVSGGGYTEEVPMDVSSSAAVAMERLGANCFRFVYYESTVKITLNDKTNGSVEQTYKDSTADISGSYDIKKVQ
jgi:hypothetical protein